tara:strand:+ start:183 stop:761 length:579 start_codon:yes stop_codon:yes gene_type:complete
MINIILFGPPGSGKGTQAEFITKEHALIHISTGDIFRNNIAQKTKLGKLASEFMNKGELVPDKLTIDLLESEIDNYSDANGFVFDGFPRTLAQAEAFKNFLNQKKIPLSAVISLEVGEHELVSRLLKRGIDSGREDDKNTDVIRQRIQVYEKQTSILKTYYSNNLENNFFSINGERSIHIISEDIMKILSNY